LPIALAAQWQGLEIHVATTSGSVVFKFKGYGFRFHELQLSRSDKSIFKEMNALLFIYKLMCKVKPDLVHLVM